LNKGKILISNFTLLNDNQFNKSVILIVKDDSEATIGFILNKKTNYLISDLNESCVGLDLPVYEGGPVGLDSLHFVHKKNNLIYGSIKISDDLCWGIDFNGIIKLLKKNKIKKDDIKFFIGYSGWGKNQLSDELNENSWLISSKFSSKDIFTTSQSFWKKKINEFGEYYKIWSNSPDNPNLN
tara:strand:+ start:143 stop:688 length:546 start_codon:yes stop_codon:yes gene_type:complete